MAIWQVAALMTAVLTHHAVSLLQSQPPARFRRSTVRETLTICYTSGCQSASSQFAGTP
jgi:hypothetical protein